MAIVEGQVRNVQWARRFPRIMKEGGIWHCQVLVQHQVCYQLLCPRPIGGRS